MRFLLIRVLQIDCLYMSLCCGLLLALLYSRLTGGIITPNVNKHACVPSYLNIYFKDTKFNSQKVLVNPIIYYKLNIYLCMFNNKFIKYMNRFSHNSIRDNARSKNIANAADHAFC
jgi:hypothetical protein